MQELKVVNSGRDFSGVKASMQRYVDLDVLPGVSWAVLSGRDLIEVNQVGWADRENKIELRSDHVFRAFSNTKLVTSIAVLLLFEAGHFALDDPIERFIPKLGSRRVLRRDPSSIDDTDPAAGSITIRHLLTHTSGLSYGLFDPGTVLYKAYQARKVLSPMNTLEAMTDVIADLPLSFHPGTAWQYSVATDVLARLVEVVSGQPFDGFIKARILDPLGMVDTGFVVPQADRDRFVRITVEGSVHSQRHRCIGRGISSRARTAAIRHDVVSKADHAGIGGILRQFGKAVVHPSYIEPGPVVALETNQIGACFTDVKRAGHAHGIFVVVSWGIPRPWHIPANAAGATALRVEEVDHRPSRGGGSRIGGYGGIHSGIGTRDG